MTIQKLVLIFTFVVVSFGQKPTIGDVVAGQATASVERKSNEKAAVKRASQLASNGTLEAYKQEERFQKLEAGLLEVERTKLAETQKTESERLQVAAAAAQAHTELLHSMYIGIISAVGTLLAGLVLMVVKSSRDSKHHVSEERQLGAIHALVNSSMTAAMQRELMAMKAEQVALESVDTGGKHSKFLEALNGHIILLEAQVVDRIRVQDAESKVRLL